MNITEQTTDARRRARRPHREIRRGPLVGRGRGRRDDPRRRAGRDRGRRSARRPTAGDPRRGRRRPGDRVDGARRARGRGRGGARVRGPACSPAPGRSCAPHGSPPCRSGPFRAGVDDVARSPRRCPGTAEAVREAGPLRGVTDGAPGVADRPRARDNASRACSTPTCHRRGCSTVSASATRWSDSSRGCVRARAVCWSSAARRESARPPCYGTCRQPRRDAGSPGRRASSPRWSSRSPACMRCARRCSTVSGSCRARSATR